MDLDDVAGELYALPPGEFVAARKQREAEARAAGERDLARRIGALAKPSTAAWACNLLVRARPEEVAQLVELGGLLGEAQRNLAGEEVRALDVERRRLVSALGRQTRALADEQGRPVTAAVGTQVEETLRAAMADPEAGQALLTGRLTTALSYSGLGTAPRPDLRLVRPARQREEAGGHREEAGRSAEEERRAEVERRAEEERRRRALEEARRAVEQASGVAAEAAAAEETAAAEVGRVRGREATVRQRIDELAAELARLQAERDTLAGELREARRRRQAAARRTAEAAAERDRAQGRLDELGGAHGCSKP